MNCADVEILLAEYVEGTLHGEAASAVRGHLETCLGCRELAADAVAAVAFLGRVAEVEAPAELVTRILFEIPQQVPLGRRWIPRFLEPVLQPRWAMGMGMAVMAYFMLAPHVRQLNPSDLNPAKVWSATEDKASRAWERGVKSYENMRVVYQIETRLKQWNEEADAAEARPGEKQ
jgi:hypothetical protein